MGGAGTIAKANATQITGNVNRQPLNNIFNAPANANDERPQAYLNYVFFDELLRPVDGDNGFDRVKSTKDDIVQMAEKTVKQNGYVYVYLSNESSEPVYFDDFLRRSEC